MISVSLPSVPEIILSKQAGIAMTTEADNIVVSFICYIDTLLINPKNPFRFVDLITVFKYLNFYIVCGFSRTILFLLITSLFFNFLSLFYLPFFAYFWFLSFIEKHNSHYNSRRFFGMTNSCLLLSFKFGIWRYFVISTTPSIFLMYLAKVRYPLEVDLGKSYMLHPGN